MVDDELRVSGLDAATSLIQNAKNLLNAVILTVKAAFIASTKYRPKELTQPHLVEWRMAPPRQNGMPITSNGYNQNAVNGNGRLIIRRVSERKPQAPSTHLSTQFQAF